MDKKIVHESRFVIISHFSQQKLEKEGRVWKIWGAERGQHPQEGFSYSEGGLKGHKM